MTNAIRYELTRLRTVRSTWVLLGSGLVLQALIALIVMNKTDLTPGAQLTMAFDGLPLLLVSLFSTAVAVSAFGHEYRYGTITTTMLTLRAPGKVLAAKGLTCGALAAATGAALVAVTLAVQAAVSSVPGETALIARTFAAVMVYTTLAALVGLAIAALARNATFAMVAAIGLPTVVEMPAMLAGVSPKLMPFTAAGRLVDPSVGHPALTALPLLGLTAGLLTVGGIMLARRDV
ncbi:ABC transporter permease [Nocardia huaxiensis]|uniref:ABC transporter permease n=1 Tax=Nocardia huaxiensis TaxID=2755382 RepID=A0A7D6ZLP9_9NOCA|nr:ABC transporter permease [Nocardia huaxiensis]QLY30343.1 ABC transporter permease [Nocardia huaxiensis]